MTEASVLSLILRLGRGATRLFRNNTGQFRTEDWRVVRTGLCVGSSAVVEPAISVAESMQAAEDDGA